MAKNLFFRAWFYFRQGWSTYFAFLFAAINTLTVTYFLAIEEYPILHSIFPSFLIYVLIIMSIGIPILILVGYAHFKRTSAFKAEADINIESNPHFRRILSNTELLFPILIKLLEINTKMSNNEKLSEAELNELNSLKEILKNHMKKNTI
tara:strand:- start:2569 stop:3018 length:450 start_codon:yes stop_codon:yes gene_type:complete